MVHRARVALVGALAAGCLGGCGGERQDAGAPSGEFRVEVLDASFPARQAIAQPATLRLEVANRGDRAVPDLAVTVETAPGEEGEAPISFGQRGGEGALSDSSRPVWVLDAGPVGGDSAYANTWALGALPAGATRAIEWRLTALRPGRYTVGWRLAPALVGDARIAGDAPAGEFDVTIADAPVSARVAGDGDVVRGDAAAGAD